MLLPSINKWNVSCWNSSYESLVSSTTSTFRKSQKPNLALSSLSSLNFLTTMSFNSVIPLWDSARANWRLESAKLDVTLTACDLVVGVCVSRCKISDGWKVDSQREVSWNGSMCTVSCQDNEPTAALVWEADPLGALKSLFAVRWCTMWSQRKSKLSLVHFYLCVSCGSNWPDIMWVTFPKSVHWLWNHLWQASLSKLFSSQNLCHKASLLDLSL